MFGLIRFAKAWAVVNMIMRLALVFGFLVLVMAVVFSGGVEVHFKWGWL